MERERRKEGMKKQERNGVSSSFYEDIRPMRSGPHCMTSFNLLSAHRLYLQIHSHWELGLPTCEFQGLKTQFITSPELVVLYKQVRKNRSPILSSDLCIEKNPSTLFFKERIISQFKSTSTQNPLPLEDMFLAFDSLGFPIPGPPHSSLLWLSCRVAWYMSLS